MKSKTLISFFFFLSICANIFSQGESSNLFETKQPDAIYDTTLAAEYVEKGSSFSKADQYDSSKFYYEKAQKIYYSLSLNKEYDQRNIWENFIRCSNQICLNLMRLGKYDSCLTLLDKTLKLGLEKFGENHKEVAFSYYNFGYLYHEKGDYDRALKYYRKSLLIRIQLTGENNSDVAVTYNDIGVVYFGINDYDRALENHNKSLSIRLKLFGEENANVSQSYNNIGVVYMRLGNYDKALEYYQKSLSINRKIFQEENLNIANNYINIGNVFYYNTDYNKALEYFQKTLAIRLRLLGENHPGVAGILVNIGVIYIYKGDYDKALESFRKSLSIRIKALGEDHPDVAASYNNLAAVYYYKGDYDKALEIHERSLSIKLKTLGKEHNDVAVSYINIAGIFSVKGDYEKAMEYYNKYLSILNKLYGEKDQPEAVICYNNIGDVYRYQEDYDNALKSYQKSLAIGSKLFDEEQPQAAKTYMNIGIIYGAKNNFSEGMKYLRKSLLISLGLFGEYHPDVAEIYMEIAKIYKLQNNYDTALVYCQKSLSSLAMGFNDKSVYNNPALEEINNESNLLNTLKLKAKIFLKKSDLTGIKDIKTALSTYDLAVKLIDKMRTGYKAEGSKLFLGKIASEVYEQAIRTSLKLYNVTKEEYYRKRAFLFAEKSKAAVLQEELKAAEAIHFSNLPANLLNEEKKLRIDLAFYDTNLQNEYLTKDPDSIKIRDYKDHLFELKNRYEKLISEFESNYPDYYDLKYQSKTISIQDIQKLIQDNTILLEYIYGDSSINIFTISKNKFDIISIKKPGNFSNLVKDFYSSVVKAETKKYLNTANELSKLIIDPILQEIKSKKNLVVIPHNLLYKIPFEALFTNELSKSENENQVDYSKLNYLIKSFNISYHYSASLYANSLKDKSVRPGESDIYAEQTNEKKFIGFAPVFPSNDLTGYTLASEEILSSESDGLLRTAISDRKKFNELKYSEWEVKSIIDLFAEKNNKQISRGYFYSNATEETFKSNISNYEIIHIATHSFINEIKPKISGVVFAQPIDDTDTTTVQDGILYAGEIYNLNLNANLVVLSSCESGLGKLIRGEGMMALTRGFLFSGAENIIFSLWKIPDKHTSELMIEFYKSAFGGLSGKSYSESLRQAKLTLIKNQSTARPRSWASFLLIGGD